MAKNEIFGPVAILIPFENDEEVIEMANAYPYGLSGAVHIYIKSINIGTRAN